MTGIGTNIRVVVSDLEGGVENVIKKLTLDIVANLVRAPSEGGTPVDTGWARSNWIPSIGTSPESPAGSKENVTDAQRLSGEGEVLGYQFGQGTVYITNNVPYIKDLNEGTSQQAPEGFVQKAIQEAVNGLRTLP